MPREKRNGFGSNIFDYPLLVVFEAIGSVAKLFVSSNLEPGQAFCSAGGLYPARRYLHQEEITSPPKFQRGSKGIHTIRGAGKCPMSYNGKQLIKMGPFVEVKSTALTHQ